VRRIGRGRVRIGGSFPIEEFNERFGTGLPEEDYHTVGGFVFGAIGRAPQIGDTIRVDGARFEVSGVDGPRITEVDVSFAAVEQPAPPPE
jgi:CBS domain containing-hemolysin-like protein